MIQGMDNEQIGQNLAQLVIDAADELIKILIGDKKHGEVVKKYYKPISAIFRSIKLETKNVDTLRELNDLQGQFLKCLKNTGATETRDHQYTGRNDNKVQYKHHYMDFKTTKHLIIKLGEIVEDIAMLKVEPAETEQDATSDKKNSKLDFFYKIYEKTLKALFSAVIERFAP